ncbi:hypothetical protein [Endozoicomonas sp. Mp262]|uniref:hypothetical protein n=1 Tax=Endozoicomonas sp. Mp262 TaxID=2919499 RepID=UPI0021DB3DD1
MVSSIGNKSPGVLPPGSPEDVFQSGRRATSTPSVNSRDQQDFEKLMAGHVPAAAEYHSEVASPSATQEDVRKFQANMCVDALMNNRIEVEKEQW